MKSRIYDSFIIAVIMAMLAACGGSGGGGVNQPIAVPPPSVTAVTQQFSNTGFASVDISNSFSMIVQEGDQFSVEMTVDSDDIDLVSITQEGSLLRVEFDPTFQGNIETQVARGVITMPVLENIEVSGSALVDMAGFAQSFLKVTQSGNSHIEGSNSRIDFVSANLSGSSHLSLQNVLPLPAADIELTGSSQATLNMMNGGTLTGQASGSSNLSYFGNGLSVQVAIHDSATVTSLGANPL